MRRLLSILLGLVCVAFLWSIRELKEQARRVERGVSLLHISQPTRLGMISYSGFCFKKKKKTKKKKKKKI